MTDQQIGLDVYDEWLKDDGDVAAIVMRQRLEPVAGKDAIIFPPTYAAPKGKMGEDWTGYNIDRFQDGSSVCQIDSVGSQANRMEPLFKKGDCSKLVPQVVIKAGDREVNLLEAGHRAADAIARFSTLAGDLNDAFGKFQKNGNAEPLARIAPTSIVFGSWDSRGTQAKLPRVVGSVIRAYDVDVLHRSAQYTTIAGEIIDEGEAEVAISGPKAELGFAHVPAVQTHGGIRVKGEIRREAVLNLSAIRALIGTDKEGTLKLRRYILGLALVVFTSPQETFLREGCQLVPDQAHPAEWHVVRHEGSRDTFSLSYHEAIKYAQLAAAEFGVGPNRAETFDSTAAKKAMSSSKKSRSTRQGVEMQASSEDK